MAIFNVKLTRKVVETTEQSGILTVDALDKDMAEVLAQEWIDNGEDAESIDFDGWDDDDQDYEEETSEIYSVKEQVEPFAVDGTPSKETIDWLKRKGFSVIKD